jgi:hypothetical protein
MILLDNKALKDPVQEKAQEQVPDKEKVQEQDPVQQKALEQAPVSHEEPLDSQSTNMESALLENKTCAVSTEVLIEKMDIECESSEQTANESALVRPIVLRLKIQMLANRLKTHNLCFQLNEESTPTLTLTNPQINSCNGTSEINEEKMQVTPVHNKLTV